jgi:hypothetical protein
MEDKGDTLAHIHGIEQGVEVAAVFDEATRAGATFRQLVRVAHANQVGGDAEALRLQVRQHIAPKVRRGGIAVQQHHGVAHSHLHVSHLPAENPPPLLVRKCRRDHASPLLADYRRRAHVIIRHNYISPVVTMRRWAPLFGDREAFH